jgi:Ni/Co efflux regulator RcnB
MKKALLLLTFAAFSTAAFAQTQEPMKTETTVRSNGTVKTEARTGRTEAGQAVHNTKEGTKKVARKTGTAIDKGAHKTGHAVKKGAKAVKNKAEDVVD